MKKNRTTIKHHSVIDNKNDFFDCYAEVVGLFMHMTEIESYVFYYFLHYGKGVNFDITEKIHLDIAKEIAIDKKEVAKIISTLLEKEMLIQSKTGLYHINATQGYTAFKKDANGILKFIIEIEYKG